MNWKEFVKKYNINESIINQNLKEKLLYIYSSYKENINSIKEAEEKYIKIFSKFDFFYKKRIKDPEHLIEKIIRDIKENPSYANEVLKSDFNIFEQYNDLLGLRIITLNYSEKIDVFIRMLDEFKEDLVKIKVFFVHKDLYYKRIEEEIKKIESNIPNWNKNMIDYIPRNYDAPYNSIHLILKNRFDCLKNIEIQIRTYYEEAWSEIDHKLKYPYRLDDEYLKLQMLTLYDISCVADNIINTTIEYMDKILNIKDVKKEQQLLTLIKNHINSLDKEKFSNEEYAEKVIEIIKKDYRSKKFFISL